MARRGICHAQEEQIRDRKARLGNADEWKCDFATLNWTLLILRFWPTCKSETMYLVLGVRARKEPWILENSRAKMVLMGQRIGRVRLCFLSAARLG